MNGLREARERPTYTAAEVARWARTSPHTVRRWVGGYTYSSAGEARWSPPITHSRNEAFLTFDHVVEVAAVAALRRAGLAMQRIRADVEFARETLNIERPLLSERLRTDGRQIFLRDAATEPNFTNLSRSGQIAWSHLEAVLREIDYADDRLAERWWPAGRDEGVVVDPLVNFGRPVVARVGVRSETLVDRFAAGISIVEIAAEYRVEASIVEQAVRFENRPGAIAA